MGELLCVRLHVRACVRVHERICPRACVRVYILAFVCTCLVVRTDNQGGNSRVFKARYEVFINNEYLYVTIIFNFELRL